MISITSKTRENLNSKTSFYKDCSLGSVKNLSLRERGRERKERWVEGGGRMYTGQNDDHSYESTIVH